MYSCAAPLRLCVRPSPSDAMSKIAKWPGYTPEQFKRLL